MFAASTVLASTSPTTVPSAVSSGPPLLPGLIGVSVWISPVKLTVSTWIGRSNPLTVPLLNDSGPASG